MWKATAVARRVALLCFGAHGENCNELGRISKAFSVPATQRCLQAGVHTAYSAGLRRASASINAISALPLKQESANRR